MPTSTYTIEMRELPRYKLPRLVETEDPDSCLAAWLQGRSRKLRQGGKLEVPVVGLSDALSDALRAARRSGRIVRGIEAATEVLASESRGLELLKRRVPQGDRISRLLLMSGDGTDNFYRKAEGLLVRHRPRVLGCRIAADSLTLGSLLFGPGMTAKAVLVSHKQDVIRIMRALMSEMPDNAP